MKIVGFGSRVLSMNPWVRGFQPAGTKCPNCKRIGTLVFTGRYTEHGDHIYKCVDCGAAVGAPTDFAYCDRFGEYERIEKDVFHTPCVRCPFRKPVPTGRPGSGVCAHLRISPPEEFF